MLDPRAKLLPAPIVHAGFTSLATLSTAHEDGAAIRIEIRLGQVEGSLIRSPARQRTAIRPRIRAP
jgi:hypothetical protein